MYQHRNFGQHGHQTAHAAEHSASAVGHDRVAKQAMVYGLATLARVAGITAEQPSIGARSSE